MADAEMRLMKRMGWKGQGLITYAEDEDELHE